VSWLVMYKDIWGGSGNPEKIAGLVAGGLIMLVFAVARFRAGARKGLSN
jgi:hypothetical protein